MKECCKRTKSIRLSLGDSTEGIWRCECGTINGRIAFDSLNLKVQEKLGCSDWKAWEEMYAILKQKQQEHTIYFDEDFLYDDIVKGILEK